MVVIVLCGYYLVWFVIGRLLYFLIYLLCGLGAVVCVWIIVCLVWLEFCVVLCLLWTLGILVLFVVFNVHFGLRFRV